jgi:hypothetical protein
MEAYVLNTKKTKVMFVCSTRKKPTQHGMQLSMRGVQIEEVAETKLAGVQLLIIVVSNIYVKNILQLHAQSGG